MLKQLFDKANRFSEILRQTYDFFLENNEQIQEDEFKRDYIHAHIFENGESSEQQEDFLRHIKENCDRLGIEFTYRFIIIHGEPAYEFGFDDKEIYKDFVYKNFGDMHEREGHTQTLHSFDPDFLDESRNAAEQFLKEQNIDFTIQLKHNAYDFKFNSFSDRMTFLDAVEDGTLDNLIETKKQVQRSTTDYSFEIN